MRIQTYFTGLAALATSGLTAGLALAETAADATRGPVSGSIGFQPAASDLAVDQQWLDHALMLLCIVIVALVVALLAVVVMRFNRRANPTPARFTHNSPLEITWTLIPVLILVIMAAFSLPILFKQLEPPTPDVTIKVTGNQWYWSYEYPDAGVSFDSYMIGQPATIAADETDVIPYVYNNAMKAKLEKAGYTGDEFRLAADTSVVVPVNKNVLVQMTGADVIHAWYVPAMAVQHSAVPGRIGESWFKAEKEGVYFGQCTTLCGKDHAYMPIVVKVVSQDVYDAWVAANKAGGDHVEPEAVKAKLASN